jgi:hypothetical protein
VLDVLDCERGCGCIEQPLASPSIERISACELVSDDEGMRLIRYLDERGYRPEDCC